MNKIEILNILKNDLKFDTFKITYIKQLDNQKFEEYINELKLLDFYYLKKEILSNPSLQEKLNINLNIYEEINVLTFNCIDIRFYFESIMSALEFSMFYDKCSSNILVETDNQNVKIKLI